MRAKCIPHNPSAQRDSFPPTRERIRAVRRERNRAARAAAWSRPSRRSRRSGTRSSRRLRLTTELRRSRSRVVGEGEARRLDLRRSRGQVLNRLLEHAIAVFCFAAEAFPLGGFLREAGAFRSVEVRDLVSELDELLVGTDLRAHRGRLAGIEVGAGEVLALPQQFPRAVRARRVAKLLR